jgi:EcsC protein family
MTLSDRELEELRLAKALLENVNLATRIADVIGTPIEKAVKLLPEGWSAVVNTATHKALMVGLQVAVATINDTAVGPPSNLTHKAINALAGAGGGFFGLAALPIELPVSTVVMLRSIADVARSQGENPKLPASKLACLEVLALGGRSAQDDATETGYFAVRYALAGAVTEAVEYLATKKVIDESAPPLVKFIAQVAARFGAAVSQKTAAQVVPVIGAAGGGLVNLLFMDHFQDVARGHFTVRRLERTHSAEIVRKAYEQL